MMPAAFAFATAGEILFGRGQAAQVASRVALLGRHVVLVHGAIASRTQRFADDLRAVGCAVTHFCVPREPDVDLIEAGVVAARSAHADVVLAIGGGAVLDAGKAIAALVPASRPILSYLEVVGDGSTLACAPLPFVAVPTTAGTGAEVTRNAVIGVPAHRRKVSLRDVRMLPRLAVVDPALTDGCPRAVTLASGLDAITQVIEPFVCTKANAMTDALCQAAIPVGIAALIRLMQAEDAAARDDLAWVSLSGGLALANAGLGAVHGLAGPLGGLTQAAHGEICGVLLPHVLMGNRRAVADAGLAARLDQVGCWIGAAFGRPAATLDIAARLLAEWSAGAGLPTLSALGVDDEIRRLAAEAAAGSSSMKANPAMLDAATLEQIMQAAG